MTFTCEHCGTVFEGASTDEEVRAETIELFGADPNQSPDDFSVICDDCFQRFKVWFDDQSEYDRALRGALDLMYRHALSEVERIASTERPWVGHHGPSKDSSKVAGSQPPQTEKEEKP